MKKWKPKVLKRERLSKEEIAAIKEKFGLENLGGGMGNEKPRSIAPEPEKPVPVSVKLEDREPVILDNGMILD